MKKYISADLRVINVCANDIIATSTGYSDQAIDYMNVSARHGMWDDNYDEF